ncbi:MAG: hypothetical protein DRH43_10905, partial [Deltaproteobacteria bacterium]
LVEGRVTRDEKSVKILADSVIPITKAEEVWTTTVHLNLDITNLDRETLQQLYDILQHHRGGCKVYLHLRIPRRTETIIALPDRIKLKAGNALTETVNNFLGYSAVETSCQRQ